MLTDSIIDVNVTLGQWPMRRVPCDDPQRLTKKLRGHGVTEAWAGSFDGMFRDDLEDVNHRLAADCRAMQSVLFLAFGEINPLLPGWREELIRCADQHRMPGVRLHPNYHGYKLDHPEFAALLRLAAERKLIVQIVVLMEDERMMHSLLRVPPVDLAPLESIVRQSRDGRVVLLNALKGRRDETLIQLLNTPGVNCDIAMLEGAAGIEHAVTDIPVDKMLFGSHAPSLYFESSLLKLKESALPAPHLRAIRESNASRLRQAAAG